MTSEEDDGSFSDPYDSMEEDDPYAENVSIHCKTYHRKRVQALLDQFLSVETVLQAPGLIIDRALLLLPEPYDFRANLMDGLYLFTDAVKEWKHEALNATVRNSMLKRKDRIMILLILCNVGEALSQVIYDPSASSRYFLFNTPLPLFFDWGAKHTEVAKALLDSIRSLLNEIQRSADELESKVVKKRKRK